METGKGDTVKVLRRLALINEGLDWMLVVTLSGQGDDGVFTSPKG